MTRLTIFDPEVACNATDDKAINDITALVRQGVSFDDFSKLA